MLGDTFINILAVRFMAGNFALGYISSALYITALIVPFVVPFLISTCGGTVIAAIITIALEQAGLLKKLKTDLES